MKIHWMGIRWALTSKEFKGIVGSDFLMFCGGLLEA